MTVSIACESTNGYFNVTPFDACGATDDLGNIYINGDLLDTSTVGGRSLTVTSRDAMGFTAAATVNYTVVAPSVEAGQMRGEGYVNLPADPGVRGRFLFSVIQRTTGEVCGRFNFWTVGRSASSRRMDVFDAVTVDAIAFSDDPGFTPGNRPTATTDTATFSGTGDFNDVPGYFLTVTTTGRGEPGDDLDTFVLTVFDSNGNTVFAIDGLLAGGIQSLRLQGLGAPPFIAGGLR